MNEIDKKAFEKWCTEKFNIAPELIEEFKHTFIHKLKHTEEAWQSACEYKQKEIDELEKEKDYLYKKMENIRDIYKHSKRFQAENAQLRDEISELNKKLSSVWKEAEEFYLND